MSLIHKVKSTKTRASQVYATVELALLGVATVRLTGSDQRMTNLPVYGRQVKTGDTVIVDYSAEGRPFVRVSIEKSLVTKPPTNVIVNDNTVDSDDGFIAGKVSLTIDTIFTDTIVGDTFTWTPIVFDRQLYDITNIYSSTSGIFGALPQGQYICNLNLGFSISVLTAAGYSAVQFLNYKVSTGLLSPIDFRMPHIQNVRFYGGGDDHNVHIANFTTLCRISGEDEGIGVGLHVYTTSMIQPEILKEYSWFSIHKLNNLSIDNVQALRGYWDSAGIYF